MSEETRSWDDFDVARGAANMQATQAALAAQSRGVVAERESRTLAYGRGEREYVRLFPAAGSGGAAPVVALVHGGFWMLGHPDDRCFPAPIFNAAGCAYASIGYPLAPQASLEAMIAAVSAAIRTIAGEAAAAGADPARIHLVGHSAGAHLAAMAMTDTAVARHVRGLTLISGIYDLEPYVGRPAAQHLELDAATAKRFSPIVRGAAPVPTTVACGERDPGGFIRQGLLYFLSMDAARANLVFAEREDHFTILRQLMQAESPIFRAIVRQVAASAPAAGT